MKDVLHCSTGPAFTLANANITLCMLQDYCSRISTEIPEKCHLWCWESKCTVFIQLWRVYFANTHLNICRINYVQSVSFCQSYVAYLMPFLSLPCFAHSQRHRMGQFDFLVEAISLLKISPGLWTPSDILSDPCVLSKLEDLKDFQVHFFFATSLYAGSDVFLQRNCGVVL